MCRSPDRVSGRLGQSLLYAAVGGGFLAFGAPARSAFGQPAAAEPPAESPAPMPGPAPIRQPTRQMSSAEEIEEMFGDIEGEIERLRNAGQANAAELMLAELNSLRGRLTGPYKAPERDEPEVHVVGLRSGTAAPPGVLKGADRFKMGYAEVKVTYTAQSIILVLCAYERMHWQIKPAEGVRFHAVILSGRHSPRVAGLPEGTLILRRVSEEGGPSFGTVLGREGGSFDALNHQLRTFTGEEISTLIARREYQGQPLVVGPENADWRAQHILAETRALHRRASQFERDQRRAKVAKLRFRAVYFARKADPMGPGGTSAAIGDFTILGPIESGLRPLPFASLRAVVTDPKEKLQFGLNGHLELVLVEPGADDPPKVPIGIDTGRKQFWAMTIDTKRRRLVLSNRYDKPNLYALDLESSQWSSLGSPGKFLGALTYVPEEDVFYGLASVDPHLPQDRRVGSPILKLGPTGKRLASVTSSEPIGADSEGLQVIHTDGRLVVITSPRPDRWNRHRSHLYVVDPKSGEVLYSGIVQPHDGNTPPKTDLASPPPAGGGLLDTLSKKFAATEQAIGQLHKQGDKEYADQLTRRVATLRERLAGKYPAEKNAQPQLHLVGFYNADGAVVEVGDSSRPVVLALCAYDPSTWTVKVAQGVNLRRVIVGGYHSQKVKGLPENTRLEIYSHDDRTGGFHTYKRDDPRYANVARQLQELTDLDIVTFQGTYQYRGRPVVIGPENADWRIQHVLYGLEKVIRESQRKKRAQRRAALEKLRFTALYCTGGRQAGDPRSTQQIQFGEFTARGPIMQTLQPFRANVEQFVVDPRGPHYYGRRGGDISRIDWTTGTLTKIPFGAELPRLSWPSAIAFDTKRQRLLLTSFGGGGYLYAYYVDGEHWSVLRKPGLSASALVYAESEDALYAVNLSLGGEGWSVLSKFNPHGALLRQVKLSQRIPQTEPFGSSIQLKYAKGRLFIITAHRPGRHEPGETVPMIYVASPATGEILYAGKLRPHAGYEELSIEQLQSLWDDLTIKDTLLADKVVWRLAAGHDAAVEFLDKRLNPIAEASPEQVEKLVRLLDDDKYAVRQQAFEDLAGLGSIIEPHLRKWTDHPSAEVRTSIRRLIVSWRTGHSQSPEEMRELRALRALERIGTARAIDVLQRLARGPAQAVRTREAKAALERLDAAGR